jgi:hypothetical protein
MVRLSFLVVLAVLSFLPARVRAAGPKVDHLFPAGGGRGQVVTVSLSGSFNHWPVRVWVSEPGVAFEPGSEKGKLIARIAPDAVPGPRLIRVHDDEGASPPRPFLVGTLPETVEQEPNEEPAKSQKIERLPVVVNGRLGKRGDVDTFEVELKKGQTLVAALEGQRRLGAPMDGVVQVVSADGFVLEQVDDSPDLDPLLRYTATADGRYHVRVFAFPSTPDSSIALAGGAAFVYRLTLTTAGYLEQAMPLAIESGRRPTVSAIGSNIPADLGNLCVEPTAGEDRARIWHPRIAGDLLLSIVNHPCLVENEAGPGGQSRSVPVPSFVSGRIERDDDQDRFRVTLKKGEACRFRVEARALGSPLDPILRVASPGGEILVEQDDTTGRDAEINFTAPRDGAFDVVVSELNGQGGPSSVYLLALTHPEPDFTLELTEDRISIAPGKPTEVTVKVSRRDGFSFPVAIEPAGLPPGVTARPATSEPKGDSASTVRLTLEAMPGAKPSSSPFQVVGRSKDQRRSARAPVPGIEAATDQIWLTVTRAAKP